MKVKFYFSVVIVVCLLMLSTGCGFFRSEPSDTIKRFYTAIDEGKVEEAINQLSSQSVASVEENKLRAIITDANENIKNSGGIKSIEIEDEYVKDGYTRIFYRFTYGNGVIQPGYFDLIQENGEWKIRDSLIPE